MEQPKLKQVAIKDILPYENNPRENDNAVDAVTASIRRFGFKVPIVLDANNVIICGHTRFKAAVQLGLKTVPCIIAANLTEEQAKAFRLVDNKVAELSEWDEELREKELMEIRELGLDMQEFGFEEVDTDFDDSFFKEHHSPAKDKEEEIVCPFCGERFAP